jgi:hypothetical protein
VYHAGSLSNRFQRINDQLRRIFNPQHIEAASGDLTFKEFELFDYLISSMAKALAGSRTENNLAAAFAGESMARNRYTFFASIAQKEGCDRIGAISRETAENETSEIGEFVPATFLTATL